ncbi:MAG: cyanophycinase [Polyangia bacterium]
MQDVRSQEPFATSNTADPRARGHLVIIGGGERPERIMRRIVELAGGALSDVVIFPMASEAPLSVAASQRAEFLALGAGRVDSIHCTREDADDPANLLRLRSATCVFFSGGDQRKLTAALLGTRLLEHVRAVYQRGGVLAGTSAGAAVMSRIMITGDEHPLDGQAAGGRYIHTASGFGFIDRAIIDQHFLKRGRHYRLSSLIARHPELIGIGIDEATAIIVNPDDTFSTLGDSDVLVFAADRSVDAARTAEPRIDIASLSSGKRFCLSRNQLLG